MSLRKLLSAERGAAVLAIERRSSGVHVRLGALALSWPLWLSLAIGAAIFLRTMAVWAPEGDSALHFKLMKDIAATGRPPDHLPYYAARVGEGGEIEAMFPYAYTPLFHWIGAAMYLIAGSAGIALMNGASAAVIGLTIYGFTVRRLPRYVASGAALAAFVAPTTLSIFTHVYMEPVMLAFVFAGSWYYYIALTTRRVKPAIVAGLLLGLAVGTRQAALLYDAVLALLTLVYLFERGALQPSRIAREARWLAPFAGTFTLVAAPFMLYLFIASGNVGYGDIALPGTSSTLAIDAQANAYISSITNPELSPLHWIDRYRRTVLYSERWLPLWFAALPFAFAAIGVAHMERRGGGARFLARFVAAQLITEMMLFAVVHGNDRYVIASRILFYSTLPVGLYVALLWIRRHAARCAAPVRIVAAGGMLALAAALGAALFGQSYLHYFSGQQRLMSVRSEAYADAGAWANASTPDDALFLAPRVYSGELTFERNLTWVTFYGNLWVVDAMSAQTPREANTILSKHGVDYVLIADPPGTYIDRMPVDGMRSYLQFGRVPTRYFELVYMTHDAGVTINGAEVDHALRIYRVVPQRGAPAGE
jgi:hypothetical protein